jgi:hypothetical protein
MVKAYMISESGEEYLFIPKGLIDSHVTIIPEIDGYNIKTVQGDFDLDKDGKPLNKKVLRTVDIEEKGALAIALEKLGLIKGEYPLCRVDGIPVEDEIKRYFEQEQE